jgi:hypothetical protein
VCVRAKLWWETINALVRIGYGQELPARVYPRGAYSPCAATSHVMLLQVVSESGPGSPKRAECERGRDVREGECPTANPNGSSKRCGDDLHSIKATLGLPLLLLPSVATRCAPCGRARRELSQHATFSVTSKSHARVRFFERGRPAPQDHLSAQIAKAAKFLKVQYAYHTLLRKVAAVAMLVLLAYGSYTYYNHCQECVPPSLRQLAVWLTGTLHPRLGLMPSAPLHTHPPAQSVRCDARFTVDSLLLRVGSHVRGYAVRHLRSS